MEVILWTAGIFLITAVGIVGWSNVSDSFFFDMLRWILQLEHFKNGGHSNKFYRITAYWNRRQGNWVSGQL